MKEYNEKLTPLEYIYMSVIRHNMENPPTKINKEWRIKRLRIVFNWRSSENLTGRFGGGWNWECGFQIGGHTIILNLLIFSIRFELKNKPNHLNN
jgi:hypothetical protein